MGLPIGDQPAVAAVEAREALIAAATACIHEEGWHGVTLERIARRAGLGRLTVQEHFTTKQELARAMVDHELGRFLQILLDAFNGLAQDPALVAKAASSAAFEILSLGQAHPTIEAIVRGDPGSDTDLLPLFTTQVGEVRGSATAVLEQVLAQFPDLLTLAQRRLLAEIAVRSVIGFMIDPASSPEGCAQQIDWLFRVVLCAASCECGCQTSECLGDDC